MKWFCQHHFGTTLPFKERLFQQRSSDPMFSSTELGKCSSLWPSHWHAPRWWKLLCVWECTYVFTHAVSGKVCVSGFCFKVLVRVSTRVFTGQENHLCQNSDHCSAWWTCIYWDAATPEPPVELVFSQHQQMAAARGLCFLSSSLAGSWGFGGAVGWVTVWMGGTKSFSLLCWRSCIITQTFIQPRRAANELHLSDKWFSGSSVNCEWSLLDTVSGIKRNQGLFCCTSHARRMRSFYFKNTTLSPVH